MNLISHNIFEFKIFKYFKSYKPIKQSPKMLFQFWAFLSLRIPSKEFLGPTTPAGYTPR